MPHTPMMDFDGNRRRRKILLRNSYLVFAGYAITQLAALLAHWLGLSSIAVNEIVWVAALTFSSTVLFALVTQYKPVITNRYVAVFHFGQYLVWLIMYGVWLLTLREIRVAALFFALIPLTFLLADTRMVQSLIVSISVMVLQLFASYYAIHVLGQTGSFKLEAYFTLCFAPAALFLCYLSDRFAKQRHEVHAAKQSAEHNRDALAAEMDKTQLANMELQRTLEALKRATEELTRSEKMAALGSLVAGISHELNTPIGNSVTVASNLQDQLQTLERDINEGNLKRSSMTQFISSASTGVNILTRSLGIASELIKSFKQVAVDRSSEKRRQFELGALLEELAITLRPMFRQTPYAMEFDLEPGIAMDSYPGSLGQIITNLVSNALVHAFEGRAQGTMHIRVRAVGNDHVELVFCDDGVGIQLTHQARVFDPFFTTKLGQGGSGLGLNIVYNLVTAVLGGSIRLESAPGQGSSMIMVLPRTAPQPAAEKINTV